MVENFSLFKIMEEEVKLFQNQMLIERKFLLFTNFFMSSQLKQKFLLKMRRKKRIQKLIISAIQSEQHTIKSVLNSFL
ncbi:hypothetical protein BpHYR1_023625 [Brachionus plicatilis]|uniref:Uncharacterized protein n=1 Tax=Brachionus plicatilis TaxID=10195 RepID=A0A3M7PMA3_BRAPC|nr:hypothetical protein BpHYR1_023625 [Brachionus plicatilis]